jgi:hypothetical protein
MTESKRRVWTWIGVCAVAVMAGRAQGTPLVVLEQSWGFQTAGQVRLNVPITEGTDQPRELRTMTWDIHRTSGNSLGIGSIVLPSGRASADVPFTYASFDEGTRTLDVNWSMSTSAQIYGPPLEPNQYAQIGQSVTARMRFRLAVPMILDPDQSMVSAGLSGLGLGDEWPSFSWSLGPLGGSYGNSGLGPVELPAGEHELFVDLGFSGSWDPSLITSRTYNADTWGLLEFRLPHGQSIVDTGSSALMLVLGAGVVVRARSGRGRGSQGGQVTTFGNPR